MNRYTVRKIFVWPAFKFGAIIGAVLMIIPGIVGGLVAHSAAGGLKGMLDAMGGFAALGGPDTSGFARQLQTLVKMGPLVVLWTTLLTIVIGGLLYGASAAIAALLYNLIAKLSGGLVVGAAALAAPAPAAQPQPQPAFQQPQIAPPLQPQAVPVIQPVAPVIQPQPQPMPWLAVGNPPQRRPLRADRTRLGSAPDNDIVLQGINPYHAEIRFEGGYYVLYDMAAGQTLVNSRPVAERNMLKDGFQLRLGVQDLVFHAN